MRHNELEAILKRLKDKGGFQPPLIDGATEEQINSFEQCNSIQFPKQYYTWLLCSDGGELFRPAGIQLYGVAHKPLIDVNDNERPDENYIVIGALASGDPILFRKGSEEIAIYNLEADRIEDDERYEDFFSFLNDLHNLLGIGE